MRYFEDVKAGDRFTSKSCSVSKREIIAFARSFDPQPFHLNATIARHTMFGGLIASGWHTAAITMRLFVQRLNFCEGAIGLGVDELRWPHPVRPGDRLRVETKIIKVRVCRSNPTYGIVRLKNVTRNQRKKIVQTMFASAFVLRRRRSVPRS